MTVRAVAPAVTDRVVVPAVADRVVVPAVTDRVVDPAVADRVVVLAAAGPVVGPVAGSVLSYRGEGPAVVGPIVSGGVVAAGRSGSPAGCLSPLATRRRGDVSRRMVRRFPRQVRSPVRSSLGSRGITPVNGRDGRCSRPIRSSVCVFGPHRQPVRATGRHTGPVAVRRNSVTPGHTSHGSSSLVVSGSSLPAFSRRLRVSSRARSTTSCASSSIPVSNGGSTISGRSWPLSAVCPSWSCP